jgi:hypothetical protein
MKANRFNSSAILSSAIATGQFASTGSATAQSTLPVRIGIAFAFKLGPTGAGAPRTVKNLYLLQVEIAVRDPRVDSTTGLVFARFIYDGRNQGDTPYAKLRPVGLMWGNDPNLGPTKYQQGQRPSRGNLYKPRNPSCDIYGWFGRLDGPVDNPKSSSLSCHSTAQWPVAAPTVPPAGTAERSPLWTQWFQNIRAGSPFTASSTSLDYSLQLASGVQNLASWSNACKATPQAHVLPPCSPAAMLRKYAGPSPKIPLGYPVHW